MNLEKPEVADDPPGKTRIALSVWFFAVILLATAVTIYRDARQRIRDIETYQEELARYTVQAASDEIQLQFRELRRAVGLFAEENRDILRDTALRGTAGAGPALRELSEKVARHFPHAVMFTVSDARGETLAVHGYRPGSARRVVQPGHRALRLGCRARDLRASEGRDASHRHYVRSRRRGAVVPQLRSRSGHSHPQCHHPAGSQAAPAVTGVGRTDRRRPVRFSPDAGAARAGGQVVAGRAATHRPCRSGTRDTVGSGGDFRTRDACLAAARHVFRGAAQPDTARRVRCGPALDPSPLRVTPGGPGEGAAALPRSARAEGRGTHGGVAGLGIGDALAVRHHDPGDVRRRWPPPAPAHGQPAVPGLDGDVLRGPGWGMPCAGCGVSRRPATGGPAAGRAGPGYARFLHSAGKRTGGADCRGPRGPVRPGGQRDRGRLGHRRTARGEHSSSVLEQTLEELTYKTADRSGSRLRELAVRLGEIRATPRDVIDIYTGAVQAWRAGGLAGRKARTVMDLSRTALLELMGYLVSYYAHYAPSGARPGPARPGRRSSR